MPPPPSPPTAAQGAKGATGSRTPTPTGVAPPRAPSPNAAAKKSTSPPPTAAAVKTLPASAVAKGSPGPSGSKSPGPPSPTTGKKVVSPPGPPPAPGGAARKSPGPPPPPAPGAPKKSSSPPPPGAPPPPGSKSPMKSTSPPPANNVAKKSPGPPPAPGSKSPAGAPPTTAAKKPPSPGPPGPPPPPGGAKSPQPGGSSGNTPTPPRSTTPKKTPAPLGGAKGAVPPIAKRSPDRSAGPKHEDGTVAAPAGGEESPVAPAVSPKKLVKRASPAAKKSAASDKQAGASAAGGGALPANYTTSTGLAHKSGDISAPPATATSGIPSARLVIAADRDVIEDWRERNIHGDVAFNTTVKDVIERLLLLRLKWDAGLEGLVPVETRGSDFISMMPVPEVVIPVAFTPRELGWEPGLTYFVWLQRSGKLDGGTKSRSELYRERLRAYYQYYAPEKEREVDAVVTDFDGAEELLFARLGAMYGPEPTESQLRRRKFQVQNDGVPLATLHAAATSSIGSTIRAMQIQHLKDTGQYDVDKEERSFNPLRPSAAAASGADMYHHSLYGGGSTTLSHPRGNQQRVPAQQPLLRQDNLSPSLQPSFQRVGDGVSDAGTVGGGFASGLIKHALTSVMTRMNGSLLLALYYKRWFLHRQVRQQQRRVCNYLRGTFDIVLRRDYYEKWKNHLGTRRMRRQVQQSTQLAAKSEGLVGDLMTENSSLKGELKRLRTQVEMLDNNNSKRLETLYSSSELAIGQIRTLTAENHQKEQLIQQLEQRLMHVGNLMLKANDEKENVLEHTAAEKLFLINENERLQNKTTLLEEALEGANKQLDEWRPRPATATCEHCPHYFDLERDMALMHKNADVLRARVKDVESEKQALRDTTNTLAAQLRDARAVAAGSGGQAANGRTAAGLTGPVAQQQRRRSPRRATPLSPQLHTNDYFNGGGGGGRGYASSDGGSPPPPPPPQDGDSDSYYEEDGINSNDSFAMLPSASAPPHLRDEVGVNTAVSGTMPNNLSMVSSSAGFMPRKIHSSAYGDDAPMQLPPPPTHATTTATITASNVGGGAAQQQRMHHHQEQQRQQPSFASTAAYNDNNNGTAGGSRAGGVFGELLSSQYPLHSRSTVEVPQNRPSVRTLADSFQDSVFRQQAASTYREKEAAAAQQAQDERDRQDRWRGEPDDNGAKRHYLYGANDPRSGDVAAERGGGSAVAGNVPQPSSSVSSSSANLSLETYFQSEQQRSDERLRMTLDRQANNRLRTSGYHLEHGTIARDVEDRYKHATHQVLKPVFAAGASSGGGEAVSYGAARSVFASAAAAASSSSYVHGAAAHHGEGGGYRGRYRVGAVTDQAEMIANREAAGEAHHGEGGGYRGRYRVGAVTDQAEMIANREAAGEKKNYVHGAAAHHGEGGGYRGGYRVGGVTDQAEMIANREAAGESLLLRGSAPHERPKAQPERTSIVTSAQGIGGIPPVDPLRMRQSIFSYSMPSGR
ncbi:Hypothetical protein, putative [Bodo saltans]|uniref:Uncharacterized protein n=1 Tax=Bodo saltans TaxID=75058 RepID=A0A0S4IUD4_BODSA|nr:Hypothetical protein, putative [Bodo saltans]|eukprot:CUF92998.1 Hypothetical protein, putative [Bodo saltans]